MKKLMLAAGCALFLTLAGCSEAPKTTTETKKAEAKPAEPIDGLDALYKMFTTARGWAGDAEVLKLDSIILPEVPAVPGKAAAWQATFVSPSKSRVRSWTYSVIEAQGNLHKGVFAGLEEGWSGPRGLSKPFLIAAAKTSSEDAYHTALKRPEGAAYNKKNPGKPISFVLDAQTKYGNPTWRVIWGESAGSSNFSVMVDATSGKYVEILR
jgi:hypothetical protein